SFEWRFVELSARPEASARARQDAAPAGFRAPKNAAAARPGTAENEPPERQSTAPGSDAAAPAAANGSDEPQTRTAITKAGTTPAARKPEAGEPQAQRQSPASALAINEVAGSLPGASTETNRSRKQLNCFRLQSQRRVTAKKHPREE